MKEIEITDEMKPYIRYFEESEAVEEGWGESVLFYFGKDCDLTDGEAGRAFLDAICVTVPEEIDDVVDYQRLIRKNIETGSIVKVTAAQALGDKLGDCAAYFYKEYIRFCEEYIKRNVQER